MTPPALTALAEVQMLTRASAAIGKVDLYGPRGVTMVSADEVEAMACLLAVLGLNPTEPGAAPPSTFFRQA